MSDDIARVYKSACDWQPRSARPIPGDRRDRELDMTGLIARSVHFAPLMDDTKTFAKAEIVEDGLRVSWPVPTKWGPLDVSAATPEADRGRAAADDGGEFRGMAD